MITAGVCFVPGEVIPVPVDWGDWIPEERLQKFLKLREPLLMPCQYSRPREVPPRKPSSVSSVGLTTSNKDCRPATSSNASSDLVVFSRTSLTDIDKYYGWQWREIYWRSLIVWATSAEPLPPGSTSLVENKYLLCHSATLSLIYKNIMRVLPGIWQ